MVYNEMKTIPTFGYELIRDNILRSVLGKHEEEVLYWAGKELARKFPLFSIEEAASFLNRQVGERSLWKKKARILQHLSLQAMQMF